MGAAPAVPDASTGTNAAELGSATVLPLLADLPRLPVEALAEREDLRALLKRLVLEPARR